MAIMVSEIAGPKNSKVTLMLLILNQQKNAILYSSRFMTIESAFFIEPKIVFGEIQPLLEIKFSLFHIHSF